MNPAASLLEAAPNFRDFGGLPTGDGRRVREGRLFRSGLLVDLTPNDAQTLRRLDIGLVCDLRSPAERRRIAGHWPADLPVEHLALDIDAELSSVQPDKWSRKLRKPDFGAEQARDAMLENYRRMPSAFARDLRALIDYLLRPGARAILVHCAVGKDRTGFVSAALLGALGVGRDQVLAEYSHTSRLYPPERMIADRNRFLPLDHLDDRTRAALGALVRADTEYLLGAFQVVDDSFGGLDAYLEDQCGLDAARRQALQECLLEPAAPSA